MAKCIDCGANCFRAGKELKHWCDDWETKSVEKSCKTCEFTSPCKGFEECIKNNYKDWMSRVNPDKPGIFIEVPTGIKMKDFIKKMESEKQETIEVFDNLAYNERGELVIKDSGNRTEFPSGAVRDMHTGKGRYDLIPWEAVHELALHCENGAIKYGERNCEKGIPIHSLIDSAIRHLSCYLRGMKDEPHLRAAMWNIAFAIWMEKNIPDMQDIPVRMEDTAK